MPTSPFPNWDEVLAAAVLEPALAPVFAPPELLSSPHAAISSANAPAPPAPTIFRNFERDAGSLSIWRSALSCVLGSSIGGASSGGCLPRACARGTKRISGGRALARGHLLVARPVRSVLTFGAVLPGERELEENAELLRRGYAAFADGDLDAAMQFFADDIRWQGPRSNGLPDSGTFHGKDEVA